MEYKPVYWGKRKIPFPWGYYPSPEDPKVLLPNKTKLDALHHAYRMRIKYKTSFVNCCNWLYQATGQRMSHVGFLSSFRRWKKRVRSENAKKFHNARYAKMKQHQQFVEEAYKDLNIIVDDKPDIAALAEASASEAIKAQGY